MYYVLWTTTGNEENTRQMINDHFDSGLFSRCIIPYRKKRHFHGEKSLIVKQMLFPSYVFVETDHIKDFADRIKWYPGGNSILHTDDLYCPVYPEEEYFLNRLINPDGVIDISEGYEENDKVHVVSGPLRGQEEHIKKVIWRRGVAILEMNLFHKTNQVRLGLERRINS